MPNTKFSLPHQEAAQLKEHAEAMLGAAKKKEAELEMRVQRMQQDLETLRAKEKFIIQASVAQWCHLWTIGCNSASALPVNIRG